MRPKRYLPEESKQLHHDSPTPTRGLDGFFCSDHALRPASAGTRRTNDCRKRSCDRPFSSAPISHAAWVLALHLAGEIRRRPPEIRGAAKSGFPPVCGRYARPSTRRPRTAFVIRHEWAVAYPEPPGPIRLNRNADPWPNHDHFGISCRSLKRDRATAEQIAALVFSVQT
jgi:hypothetical protein